MPFKRFSKRQLAQYYRWRRYQYLQHAAMMRHRAANHRKEIVIFKIGTARGKGDVNHPLGEITTNQDECKN